MGRRPCLAWALAKRCMGQRETICRRTSASRSLCGQRGGAPPQVAERERRQREQQVAEQRDQRERQEMQGRSNTCKGFGFKEGSEALAQCMFDLYKLEQSAAQNQALRSQAASDAAQNQALRSQAASDAAAQRALLQQQIDQQNFNQGIQLLQQSQRMLNPPTPTTTCQWNDIMQTMTCR